MVCGVIMLERLILLYKGSTGQCVPIKVSRVLHSRGATARADLCVCVCICVYMYVSICVSRSWLFSSLASFLDGIDCAC